MALGEGLRNVLPVAKVNQPVVMERIILGEEEGIREALARIRDESGGKYASMALVHYLPELLRWLSMGGKESDNRFDCEFRDMLLPLAIILWETPSFRAVTLLELADKAFIDKIGYFL